jgi:hypothetical protein
MSLASRNFLFSFLFFFFQLPASQANAQELKFIPNKNQWPSEVQFVSPIPGGRMILKPGMIAYHFRDYQASTSSHLHLNEIIPDGAGEEIPTSTREHLVHVNFVGANTSSIPVATGKSKAYFNFYLDGDPSKWASEVYGYEEVKYSSFYDGIDLKIYVAGANMKYDFVIAPEADPSQILLDYEGADNLDLENGNLFIRTTLAEVIEKKPYAYQMKGHDKVAVKCEFVLSENCVSFNFPEGYDPCHALVIDPLLIFSTYSGSTADNWGSTATPGENGTLYSSGVTRQALGGYFPATPGAFQTSSGGQFDISILKYDSTGADLLYATYLGGSQSESPHSLIMNDDQELIVLGTTSSANFPTTAGAYDRTFNRGPINTTVIGIPYTNGSDIVVAKFNATGTSLLSSTFLGGSGNDGINRGDIVRNYGDELRGDVITDDEGNIYVGTITSSKDFNSFAGSHLVYHGGGSDGLVLKLKPDLSEILWGSLLGGSGAEACYTIKLDADKNLYVAGGTTSADFPVSADAFQPFIAGDADGWICKLSPEGQIVRGTFTGTESYDQVYFLDLSADKEIYVYGQTSGNFKVSPGVFNNPGSGQFIQKFDNSLSTLAFSTVFGSGRGIPDISPTAFSVNECNNLYMTGWGGGINHRAGYWPTSSTTKGMPVTIDAFQKNTTGNDFYFIVLEDDAEKLLYATYLGGSTSLTHVDGGTSRFDKSGVVYHAVCSGCNTDGFGPKSDFPTTKNAWSRKNMSKNCNNAAFKFDLSSLRALIQTNSVDYDMPNLAVVCIPDTIRFQNQSLGGEIFQWDLGDGTTVTATDTLSILHRYENEGKYIVKLKAIDQGTCKVVDSTAVVVNVFRKNIEVEDDRKLCEGTTHTLQAGGGVVYNWTSTDTSFHSSDANPVVSPKDTTAYYVTITDANGCMEMDTIVLNVVPGVVPDFIVTREADCSELPTVYVKTIKDSIDVHDTISFDLGDGSASSELDFTHQYQDPGLYTVTLTAERESCEFKKSMQVPVFTLKIPNVITPDGNGKNDTFVVQYGAENYAPFDYGFKTSFLVYNRWGNVVYETRDYRNDWSAAGLAAGIYYYEVTVEGHGTCKSWVHVIR